MCFFARYVFKLLALVLVDHPMGVLCLLDKFLGYLYKLLSCLTTMAWHESLAWCSMSGWSLLGPSSILSVPELEIPFALEDKGEKCNAVPGKALLP